MAPRKSAPRASSNTSRGTDNRFNLTIVVDGKTNDLLARKARAEGTSKGALVFQAISQHYGLKADPVRRRPHVRSK